MSNLPESGTEGVKGACPLEEAPHGASMLAEASTNGGHNPLETAQPNYKIELPLPQGVAPLRPLAKRGNPTIQIPPLYYNPQEHTGWVYIVASQPNGHIYVGQTANLPRRAHEHREGLIPGYSKNYGCKTLVYFEGYQLITESIAREDAMKYWKRAWKVKRILETNPTWHDLYPEVCNTSQ